MRLKNKIALVTGAAGGLGSAIARRLSEEGAKVIMTDVSDGTKTAKEIGATFLKHDVSSEEQWIEISKSVHDEHGQLDVLVNAAGILGNSDGTPLGSYELWKKVMSINLDGTFLGCRAFLPSMMERGKGSIVNIASMTSFVASPNEAAYGASKAGVWQLTRSIAAFLGHAGTKVRCNSVHPGIIRTPMVESLYDAAGEAMGVDKQVVEDTIKRLIPMGFLGDPTDVGNMVLFLASDESTYITGSDFKVDGGWEVNNPKIFG